MYLDLSSIGIETLPILKKLTASLILSASQRDSTFVILCKGLSIIKSIEIDEIFILFLSNIFLITLEKRGLKIGFEKSVIIHSTESKFNFLAIENSFSQLCIGKC